MVDFTQLLRKPAGEAKKPPALPADDYPGVIKAWELGDKNKNNTPYVRFTVGLTDWGPSVPDEWTATDDLGKTFTVTKADVDLSKKQLRRDFYLTDDALWRLDTFLRSIGLGGDGRSYEEILPESLNAAVLVSLKQDLNQTTNEIFNTIDKLVGQI